MSPLERSIKRRVCDKINEGAGPLAYLETPWEDLAFKLLEIIQREAPSGSLAVEQAILHAMEDFTQGMPQTDDITFLVVEKSI